MAQKSNRYRDFDRLMTYVLLADCACFLLYLFFAGFGVLWGKIAAAALVLLISGCTLGYLYLTGELAKRRSLWMGVGAAALALCLVVSLVCNYPSPNKLKEKDKELPQSTCYTQGFRF